MESEDLPDILKDMNAVLKHVDCTWLNGKPPDYTLVNKLYLEERSIVHKAGSLEYKVNNLMKNWERELSYKTNPLEWKTALPTFRMNVNGTGWLSLPELAKMGAYNAFVGDTEYYCASRVPDAHLSHQIFRSALSAGFGWEVVEAYSPAPLIVFKWRHWGKVTGELKCPMRNGENINVSPTGKNVEIFGVTKILVNEKYQIVEMEHYFRADTMIEQMIKDTDLKQSTVSL